MVKVAFLSYVWMQIERQIRIVVKTRHSLESSSAGLATDDESRLIARSNRDRYLPHINLSRAFADTSLADQEHLYRVDAQTRIRSSENFSSEVVGKVCSGGKASRVRRGNAPKIKKIYSTSSCI
jgi:hypothetical protein